MPSSNQIFCHQLSLNLTVPFKDIAESVWIGHNLGFAESSSIDTSSLGIGLSMKKDLHYYSLEQRDLDVLTTLSMTCVHIATFR